MAGEPIAPQVVPAAPAAVEAPLVTAAPIAAAPEPVAEVAAPVVEAVVEAPEPVVAEPAAPEAEPVEAAPEEKVAEPAAEPAPVEAKPAEAQPEAAPLVVAPVYEDFKLPEGLQAAPEQISSFHEVLGKHGLSQEAGQELMDLHASALQSAHEAMQQQQRDVFSETRQQWVKDFDKQAGNRRDTILNDAKFAIHNLVKDTKERAALHDVLAFTGAGDHPAVVNLLAKAGKKLREGVAPPPSLPNNGAKSGRPEDRRYGAPPPTTRR